MEKLSMTNRFNSRGLTSEMGWWEMKYAQGERYYIMERIQSVCVCVCVCVCVGEARGGMPSGWDWRQPWWICIRRGMRRNRHATRGQRQANINVHTHTEKNLSFSDFLTHTHLLLYLTHFYRQWHVSPDNTVTGSFVGGFWPWSDNP